MFKNKKKSKIDWATIKFSKGGGDYTMRDLGKLTGITIFFNMLRVKNLIFEPRVKNGIYN